jgi:hypothetical protein
MILCRWYFSFITNQYLLTASQVLILRIFGTENFVIFVSIVSFVVGVVSFSGVNLFSMSTIS